MTPAIAVNTRTERADPCRPWLYDLPANTWGFHLPLIDASIAMYQAAPLTPSACAAFRVIGDLIRALGADDAELLVDYHRATERARNRRERKRAADRAAAQLGPNVVDLLGWLERQVAKQERK